MSRTNIKLKLLALIALLTLAVPAMAFDNSNGPALPEQCTTIAAPEGNKLSFHVYATGVQIYRWNGITMKWDFVAPLAGLFAEEKFFGEVGKHSAGPVWESKSGSLVEARRVPGTGCNVDPTAIDWLLLSKPRTAGSGIFASVTFIQRVNTTGGLAPSAPGSTDGQVKEVPYTAEYYFYRAENPNSN